MHMCCKCRCPPACHQVAHYFQNGDMYGETPGAIRPKDMTNEVWDYIFLRGWAGPCGVMLWLKRSVSLQHALACKHCAVPRSCPLRPRFTRQQCAPTIRCAPHLPP